MRGKRCSTHRRTTYPRITPARAGKTLDRFPSESRSADHPRACGENPRPRGPAWNVLGSPPRVRGKLIDSLERAGYEGITPARAGKTTLSPPSFKLSGDHPRACGENRCRMRRISALWITPARAGKTQPLPTGPRRTADHPRACGENSAPRARRGWDRGSPPRVRGKPERIFCPSSRPRITPARAGKTRRLQRRGSPDTDHPRACGENNYRKPAESLRKGSPPRVRGKPRISPDLRTRSGITPARAGKTYRPSGWYRSRTDHPRACGENLFVHPQQRRRVGSPPRVRGKRTRAISAILRSRITPARAGKTFISSADFCQHADHPRACGENVSRFSAMYAVSGSPPRVRGKRGSQSPLSAAVRITPARAGKTFTPSALFSAPWDHPRACGENLSICSMEMPKAGSPPRVRGKLRVERRSRVP